MAAAAYVDIVSDFRVVQTHRENGVPLEKTMRVKDLGVARYPGLKLLGRCYAMYDVNIDLFIARLRAGAFPRQLQHELPGGGDRVIPLTDAKDVWNVKKVYDGPWYYGSHRRQSGVNSRYWGHDGVYRQKTYSPLTKQHSLLVVWPTAAKDGSTAMWFIGVAMGFEPVPEASRTPDAPPPGEALVQVFGMSTTTKLEDRALETMMYKLNDAFFETLSPIDSIPDYYKGPMMQVLIDDARELEVKRRRTPGGAPVNDRPESLPARRNR